MIHIKKKKETSLGVGEIRLGGWMLEKHRFYKALPSTHHRGAKPGRCPVLSFFSFLFYIGVYLINNVVIVSGGQWRDSAIHTRVSIFPQTPLPSRLPRDTEQSSLCCTVGPCWLFALFFLYWLWLGICFSEWLLSCPPSPGRREGLNSSLCVWPKFSEIKLAHCSPLQSLCPGWNPAALRADAWGCQTQVIAEGATVAYNIISTAPFIEVSRQRYEDIQHPNKLSTT